jgi:hypothetical protein
MPAQLRHCDRVMEDRSAPECLRFFLQAASKPNLPGGLPPLFATLKRDFSGRTFAGAVVKLRAGERVRLTDASQFGDGQRLGFLAGRDPHDLDGIADDIGGALLAFGPLGMARR